MVFIKDLEIVSIEVVSVSKDGRKAMVILRGKDCAGRIHTHTVHVVRYPRTTLYYHQVREMGPAWKTTGAALVKFERPYGTYYLVFRGITDGGTPTVEIVKNVVPRPEDYVKRPSPEEEVPAAETADAVEEDAIGRGTTEEPGEFDASVIDLANALNKAEA